MRNVYCARLTKTVKMEPEGHHFSGRETGWLYVVASTYALALAAVERKYPGAEVRGIDLMNYAGVPIVVGN